MSELYSILNKLTPDEPLSSTQYFNIEEKVLLWENSDISSEFAAQDITLGLSDYSYVDIVYAIGTSDTAGEFKHNIATVGKIFYANYTAQWSSSYTGNVILHAQRSMTVQTSKISITACNVTLSSGNTLTSNDRIIPYRIYGIKKVGGNLANLSCLFLLKGGMIYV